MAMKIETTEINIETIKEISLNFKLNEKVFNLFFKVNLNNLPQKSIEHIKMLEQKELDVREFANEFSSLADETLKKNFHITVFDKKQNEFKNFGFIKEGFREEAEMKEKYTDNENIDLFSREAKNRNKFYFYSQYANNEIFSGIKDFNDLSYVLNEMFQNKMSLKDLVYFKGTSSQGIERLNGEYLMLKVYYPEITFYNNLSIDGKCKDTEDDFTFREARYLRTKEGINDYFSFINEQNEHFKIKRYELERIPSYNQESDENEYTVKNIEMEITGDLLKKVVNLSGGDVSFRELLHCPHSFEIKKTNEKLEIDLISDFNKYLNERKNSLEKEIDSKIKVEEKTGLEYSKNKP